MNPNTRHLLLPGDRTGALLSALRGIDGLLTLSAQRASVRPPGDIVSAQVTNRDLPALMRALDEHADATSPGNLQAVRVLREPGKGSSSFTLLVASTSRW